MLDNVVSVLNLINFNCNLIIVPEKPHWGGANKVCMYMGVCPRGSVLGPSLGVRRRSASPGSIPGIPSPGVP